jgi:hypothetical protein
VWLVQHEYLYGINFLLNSIYLHSDLRADDAPEILNPQI